MKLRSPASVFLCLMIFAAACAAGPADASPDVPASVMSLPDAIMRGQSLSSFRLRDEHVSQDGKANEGNALTLRTLLGWQTLPLQGLSVGVQLINVAVFDDAYDNGAKGVTQTGRSAYPRIADPDYTGINQLYVDWTGLTDTRVRIGRQSVKLDNVRFVGNVEFRQVMQVLDGVSADTKAVLPDTTLFAAYFNRVTQVSTLRQDTDIYLFNARHAISPSEQLIGYGYFLGWDAAPATSTRTLGVRVDGAHPLKDDWELLYTAEYAKQDPYKSGASTIDSHYARLGTGTRHGAWYARIDQEVLSSNGGVSAFQTPLGTNHLFQGWVDKFLTTPNAGIRDTFVTAGTRLGGFTLATEHHWFDSDVPFASAASTAGTATRYGREWDVSVAYALRKDLVTRLEYGSFREGAQYSAARVRDTDKLWVTMLYNF